MMAGVVADSLTTLPVIAVFSVVAVLLMAMLLIWALARDKGVLRTRFGFYIERERFEEPWPQRDRAEADTLIRPPTPPHDR